MDVRARLEDSGFVLPDVPSPVGAYLPATRVGRLVFTSGQLPMRDGALLATGRVGDEVEEVVARGCAAQCALNALAAASTVCDLSEVVGVVRLSGYVASAAGFHRQPGVVDGASEVIGFAFGESGRHAREAVGVSELPLGAPVEISLILALSE